MILDLNEVQPIGEQKRGGEMSKNSKATAQAEQRDSEGEHGGNRGGERKEDKEQSRRSSQAAGKDPHRGSDR